jgi:hypothetical protein
MSEPPSLSIFTIEADRKLILAFAAKRYEEAEAFFKDERVRTKPRSASSGGIPLCDNRTTLRLRLANAVERARCRGETDFGIDWESRAGVSGRGWRGIIMEHSRRWMSSGGRRKPNEPTATLAGHRKRRSAADHGTIRRQPKLASESISPTSSVTPRSPSPASCGAGVVGASGGLEPRSRQPRYGRATIAQLAAKSAGVAALCKKDRPNSVSL